MFSVKGSVIPSTWVRAVCHHLLQGEVTLQGLGTLEGCFLGLRSEDGVQELEEDCASSVTHQKYHLCPSSSSIIPESRCATKAPVIQLLGWVGKFMFLSRWQQNENRCHILHCPWAVSAAGRTCGVDRCLLLDPAVLIEDPIPTMEVTSDRSAAQRRIGRAVGSCGDWSYLSQAAHVT